MAQTTTTYDLQQMSSVFLKKDPIKISVFFSRTVNLSYNPNNTKKLQFITLLTAICIVSHIENSKNDKGYIT